MGRQRFRFLDIIPSTWFHKFKDIGNRTTTTTTTKKNNTTTKKKSTHIIPTTTTPPIANHTIHPRRTSYYIPRADERPMTESHPKASDTKFLASDSPRKWKKKTRKSNPPPAKLVRSSISSTCIKATQHEFPSHPASPTDDYDTEFYSLPCSDKPISEFPGAQSISTSSSSHSTSDLVGEIDIDLPPILTRPAKAGFPVRGHSPRIMGRKAVQIQVQRGRRCGGGTPRKGLLGSHAVMKASSDPRRDFRESMVEMIVENNMKSSMDLEELLACYLSLNSHEYHDVIVKVFEQVWFDLSTK